MTQAEFNSLPWLLPRKKFLQITGFSWKDLRAAVKSGQVKPWYPGKTKQGYAKYRRTDAARVCGMTL